MIYLIHPVFSLPDSPLADAFCAACDEELQRHTQTSLIKSPGQLQSVETTSQDAVVFFNHKTDIAYQPDILRILKSPGQMFPVAISIEFRVPPTLISQRQSFDVHHELELRGLNESNAATVASI